MKKEEETCREVNSGTSLPELSSVLGMINRRRSEVVSHSEST